MRRTSRVENAISQVIAKKADGVRALLQVVL